MKSCRLPTKINNKILPKEKRYSYRKCVREFLNKSWNRRGLDHLIKKIDECDLIQSINPSINHFIVIRHDRTHTYTREIQ